MREGAKQCRAKVQRSIDPKPRRCTHAAVEGGFCLKHGAAAASRRANRDAKRALRTVIRAVPDLSRTGLLAVRRRVAEALKV